MYLKDGIIYGEHGKWKQSYGSSLHSPAASHLPRLESIPRPEKSPCGSGPEAQSESMRSQTCLHITGPMEGCGSHTLLSSG